MPESSGYSKKSHSSDGKNQTKSCVAELCCGCALTYECIEDRLQMPHEILQCGRDCARPSVQDASVCKHSAQGRASHDSKPKELQAKGTEEEHQKLLPHPSALNGARREPHHPETHWTYSPDNQPQNTLLPKGHWAQRWVCWAGERVERPSGFLEGTDKSSDKYLCLISVSFVHGDQCLFYGVQMP